MFCQRKLKHLAPAASGMSWLFYSYNLDVGTDLCDLVCMVSSTFRLCFDVTEVQIVNDNIQSWLEMLRICGRSIILTGKHENTNHMCDLLLLVVCARGNYWQVLAISVLLMCLWRSPLFVTRLPWSGGRAQLWCSAGLSQGLLSGPPAACRHRHWALAPAEP